MSRSMPTLWTITQAASSASAITARYMLLPLIGIGGRRALRSRQVAGAEREGGGLRPHFGARRLVERTSPREVALRLADIGKRREPVLVGVERRFPRLLGSGEQRRCCLLLDEGDLGVVVGLPHFAHRRVLGVVQLVLGFVLLRLGEADLVAALEPFEQLPLEAEPRVIQQVGDPEIRTTVDTQLADVATDRR